MTGCQKNIDNDTLQLYASFTEAGKKSQASSSLRTLKVFLLGCPFRAHILCCPFHLGRCPGLPLVRPFGARNGFKGLVYLHVENPGLTPGAHVLALHCPCGGRRPAGCPSGRKFVQPMWVSCLVPELDLPKAVIERRLSRRGLFRRRRLLRDRWGPSWARSGR